MSEPPDVTCAYCGKHVTIYIGYERSDVQCGHCGLTNATIVTTDMSAIVDELSKRDPALLTRAEKAERELENYKTALSDPNAVHLNILRGMIALPAYYVRKTDTHGEFAKLERELAELRERTRWIPVNDDLPEQSGFYLVAYDKKVGPAFFFSGQWTTGEYYKTRRDVTHWMPLPEPPEAAQVGGGG